ncbi:MAG: DUF3237 domain-containing protein [Alphaproteobacteria bacterium]|nr:DUF3237 domain-containing protein [Alphaproteobacteria bacterium]
MDTRQQPLRTEPLFTIDMEAMQGLDLGKTPRGWRRIDRIARGRFDGAKLRGTVVTATDHLLVLRDDSARPDVRIVLETDDRHLIQMTYQGVVAGPKDVLKALGRRETVDPVLYYMRNAIFFETAMDGPYAWLNAVLAVGMGAVRIQADKAFAVTYRVFQVL